MAKSPAAIFAALRSKVLSLTPQDVKIAPLPSGVWGGLMDFAVSGVPVTLVAILDGSSSLYLGSGGGFIGAGSHKPVRDANLKFLEVAAQLCGSFQKTTSCPTADGGHVRFYILKADGVYGSESIAERDLAERRHALAPLYWAGQNLITQIRLVTPLK